MQNLEPLIGAQIGNYHLEELIGVGGMSEVYRAQDITSNTSVAFKILLEGWSHREDVTRRFASEGKILERLEHPHIVKAVKRGEYRTRPYFVLEYVVNGSLGDFLRRGETLTVGEATHILQQIASALDYAHLHGIIHRDLKPGNILLRSRDYALLTDFGIAREEDTTRLTTVDGHPVGTPEYMSPEQILGEEPNKQSDQYAFAIITYWLMTGRAPFRGDTHSIIYNQHLTITPRFPSHVNPHLPAEIDQVILRGLAKEPGDRFPMIGDFWQALQAVIATHQLEALIAGKDYGDSQTQTPLDAANARVIRKAPSGGGTQVINPAELPQPYQAADSPQPPQPAPPGRQFPLVGIVTLVVLLGALAVGGILLGGGGAAPTSEPQAAVVEVTQEATEDPLPPTATTTSTQTPTDTATSTQTATATGTPTPSVPILQPLQAVDVRLGPGPNFPVVANLATADALEITGGSEDDRWYQVLLADGSLGWVLRSETMVQTFGDLEGIAIAAAPTLTATFTPTATHTPSQTPTATFTPTTTPTATATVTATPTLTPSFSPTPTATFTPTPVPLPPLADVLNSLVRDINTPNSFNCSALVENYAFIQRGLEEDTSDYIAAADLVDDEEDALRLLLAVCDEAENRDGIRVNSRFVSEMFAEVNQVMRELE